MKYWKKFITHLSTSHNLHTMASILWVKSQHHSKNWV